MTGVTEETEAVDDGARVEGTECIAGIGIGGIIVPITGRTGTAEKMKKKKKLLLCFRPGGKRLHSPKKKNFASLC